MRVKTTKIVKLSASQQQGYLLLSVMLLITLMLIALAVAAPRIAQQIRRQKEEELVHRGKQYAIAIKKFYHKNGTYPVSLDQLESTNNQRFLRHRYKDPMTTDGEWKLVHVGEAQITMPTGGVTSPNAGLGQQGPGQAGSLTTNFPGASSGLNSSTPTSPGGLNSGGLNSGGLNQSGLNQGGFNQGGLNPGGLSGGLNPGGLSGSTPAGGPQAGGQMGTLQTSNIGTGFGANAQGGGPIIGVVSTSKGKGIKEFNGNSEYDQWLFVYDPRLEGPGGGGVAVAAPRSATPTNGAVPAGMVTAPPPNAPAGTGVTQPGSGMPTPSPSPAVGTTQPQPTPTPTPQTTPQ